MDAPIFSIPLDSWHVITTNYLGPKDCYNLLFVCEKLQSIIQDHPIWQMVSLINNPKVFNERKFFVPTRYPLAQGIPFLKQILKQDKEKISVDHFLTTTFQQEGEMELVKTATLHFLPWHVEFILKKGFLYETEIANQIQKAFIILKEGSLADLQEQIEDITFPEALYQMKSFVSLCKEKTAVTRFESLFVPKFVLQLLAMHVLKEGNVHLISPNLFNNQSFMREASLKHPWIFSKDQTNLKNDASFLLKLLTKEATCINQVDSSLVQDKVFIKKAIKANPAIFQYTELFKDDAEIVFETASKNEKLFQYANECFKKDTTFLKKILAINPSVIQYAHEDIRGNFVFMKKMITLYPQLMKYVSRNLRCEPSFMTPFIEQDGINLQFASKRMQTSKKIVMKAILQNGMALKFARNFQNDWTIVNYAYSQKKEALRFASKKILKQKKFLQEALEKRYLLFKELSDDKKNNEALIELAVKENGQAISFAPKTSITEKIALTAVKHDGLALAYVKKKFGHHHEITQTAISQNGLALNYCSQKIKKNKEMVLLAVKNNGLSIEFANPLLQTDSDVAKEAARQNWKAIKHLPNEKQRRPSIYQEIVLQSEEAYKYAKDTLGIKENDLIANVVNKKVQDAFKNV